jgi:hypothetical protein
MLWATALTSSNLGTLPTHPAPPWQWPHAPIGLAIVFPLVALALLIGIPAGLLAVATTGWLGRWIPSCPRLAPTAAATIAIAGLTIGLTLLGMLTALTPITLGAAASTLRLHFGGAPPAAASPPGPSSPDPHDRDWRPNSKGLNRLGDGRRTVTGALGRPVCSAGTL